MDKTDNNFLKIEASTVKVLGLPAHQLMSLAIILSDIIAISSAVLLAGILRLIILGPLSVNSFLWVPAYLVMFIFSAALRDLYPATGLSAVDQFRHLTITTSMLTLVIISGTYFIKVSGDFSRLLLGLSWLISLVILPLNRFLIRHLLVKIGKWGVPVGVIGSSVQVEKITSYLNLTPKIGLKPEAGLFLSNSIGKLNSEECKQFHSYALKLNKNLSINTVIVAYEEIADLDYIRENLHDVFDHVLIVDPMDFGRDLLGIKIRQYGKMQTFEINHKLVDRFAQFQKRVIDIIGAGIGLIFLSPLLLFIAFFVAIDSHGRTFYRQRRLGKNCKEFEILKFRTMVPKADEVLGDYLRKNPDRRKEWEAYQKLKEDPRITPVGRILRRFSLDELPQIWNVLRGDMSLVGPRPIMTNQRDLYGPALRQYVRVRPGITGIWQISGRNDTSFASRVEFDVDYVMNWSIWLDIYIIVRTFWVVIRHDGVF